MTNIVFLYSRLNGFVLSTARQIAKLHPNCRVTIVYWDDAHDIGNKYDVEDASSLCILKRSEYSDTKLADLVNELRPNLVYISGWMDKGYITVIRHLRRKLQFLTVCGIDDQWHGNMRQVLGRLYFKAFYRRVFDYMWVSGKPQYHYARMMGYAHHKVISNLLSADKDNFVSCPNRRKRFIFFGRLDKVKGIESLLESYNSLADSERKEWSLTIVGDGSMRRYVEERASEQVKFIPYLQPDELALELSLGGVGLMTSTFEPWAVSLHEMAFTGFPLIASRQCGAASEFLIHGYNGFLFEGGNSASLATAMRAMIALDDEGRADMGQASIALANRVTPEISARSLLSLLVSPHMPT